jgi:hypothetical protein
MPLPLPLGFLLLFSCSTPAVPNPLFDFLGHQPQNVRRRRPRRVIIIDDAHCGTSLDCAAILYFCTVCLFRTSAKYFSELSASLQGPKRAETSIVPSCQQRGTEAGTIPDSNWIGCIG